MGSRIQRVACLADNHLRTRTFARRVHFDGDAAYGFEQARLALVKLNPDMIILAGDILNSRTMEQPCGEMLRKFMRSFAGIPVLAIHGNHDRADKLAIESYGAIDLGRMGQYYREPHTLRVCGIPFDPSPERFHEKLASVPPCDILVLHQMLGDLVRNAPSHMLTAEDIPAHVRCCVIGDVHIGKVFNNSSGTTIISPGPTAHTDLGGMLEHPASFAMLEIEPADAEGGSEYCKAELVALPSREARRYGCNPDTRTYVTGLLAQLQKDSHGPLPVLKPVVVIDREPSVQKFDPADYPDVILIDKPTTATGSTEAGTLEEGADSIQDAVENYAPDADDIFFRQFLLDLIDAGPKGARGVAEARLTELCGVGWAANT